MKKDILFIIPSLGAGGGEKSLINLLTQIDFDKYNLKSTAIAGYDRTTETVFYNAKYDTTAKVVAFINQTEGYFANKTADAPLLHEFGHHFYNSYVNNLAKSKGMAYNESETIVKQSIYNKIENMGGKMYVEAISGYALDGHKKGDYSEIVAEAYSIGKEGELL